MSKATETAVKILESLPEKEQDQLVEELRARAAERVDEIKWTAQFLLKGAGGLVAAARRATGAGLLSVPSTIKKIVERQHRGGAPSREDAGNHGR